MEIASVEEVFEGLRRYWSQHAPTHLTALGDHSRDDALDDWAPGTAEERLSALANLRRELGELVVPPAAGADDGDVERWGDAVLLADRLDAETFAIEGLQAHVRDPLHYLDIATGGVHDLVRRDDLPAEPRGADAAGRAALVPRLLDQARANLGAIPAPHRQVALRRLPGAVALFAEVLPGFTPQAGDAGQEAAAALRRFGAWLAEGEDEPAPDWRLGEQRWADALRLALGVRMPAGEIWERAHAHLGQLQQRAEELAARVLEGDGAGAGGRGGAELVRAGLEVCARDHSPRDTLVEDARRALASVRAYLATGPGSALFRLPEPDALRVEEMPAFQQGVAVAFFVPAPPLETAAPHTYYLSPVPEDWDEQRALSFLREYNVHAVRSVGIHEAYPGHYVQLSFAQRHPRLVRRALWNSASAEGWAVYAEQQVIAAGFGEDDVVRDRLALTSVKMDMRSVANALLDQGLHVHGWDDQRAMHLMTQDTYQEQSEAAGKLIRGQVTAGQLSSYFVGGLDMGDLRRDAEVRAAEVGSAFDVGDFHARVLAQGAPPFTVLRRALLGG